MHDFTGIGSPSYIFDLDEFSQRCDRVKEILGDIPLTYSMKANPFLLNRFPGSISHVEVCSPGELAICQRMNIPGERIIYSGVMKERWDVEEAIAYQVDILTAESLQHLKLESEIATEKGREVKVILRLTSGNQFGMNEAEILDVIAHPEVYPGVRFYGIHYYSGTQKSFRQIRKDFQRLEHLLEQLEQEYGYSPDLVEYGPGIGAEYFADHSKPDVMEFAMLREAAEYIHRLNLRYPVGIEMGRFLASSCGHYLTRIMDQKTNQDTHYLILDGGIHQLKYYGQSMALQVPFLDVYSGKKMDKQLSINAMEPAMNHVPAEAVCLRDVLPECIYSMEDPTEDPSMITYTLCGSLCTTADILVREVNLPPLQIGDYLMFHRCGAYSVSEPGLLFLSRTMPRIWLYSEAKGMSMARDYVNAYELNLTKEDVWA